MLRTKVLRAAALVGFAASAWAQDVKQESIDLSPLLQEDKSVQRDAIVDKTLVDDTARSKRRWIGVACGDVTEMMRAHIQLPEGAGLMVEQVLPDSPAESAGLLKYDILVKIGDQPLESVNDLVQAIEQAGDQAIRLSWLRKGETLSLIHI